MNKDTNKIVQLFAEKYEHRKTKRWMSIYENYVYENQSKDIYNKY